MKEVFNPKELANRWGISNATLERWRWQGIGPSYLKIGGRIRYPIHAVEQYEAQHMYSSASTSKKASSEISLRN